jgi:hypothetical protein
MGFDLLAIVVLVVLLTLLVVFIIGVVVGIRISRPRNVTIM